MNTALRIIDGPHNMQTHRFKTAYRLRDGKTVIFLEHQRNLYEYAINGPEAKYTGYFCQAPRGTPVKIEEPAEVQTILKELGRGRFTEIVTPLQDHVAMRILLAPGGK